jgi:HK97 family phage portal protein
MLRHPDPDTTGTAYQLAKFLALQLFGNAYSVFSRDGGSGVALTPLESPYVVVVPGTDRLISAYNYSRNQAAQVQYDADQIVHLKYMPNPTDPRYGVGPLHIVSAEMDLDDAAMIAEISRWQHGGTPGGMFSFKNASAQQVRDAQAWYQQNYAGASNGGKDLFLSDADYTPFSKAVDMNYTQGLEVVEQRILGAFRIPEAIYRLNDANLASSLTAYSLYMSLCIQPTVAGVCEQETEDLLPRFGIEPGEMWFAPDDMVPDDKEAIRLNASTYVPAGILTINEIRQELGYEPVDGGDELRVNGVKLDEVNNQPAGPFGVFGAGLGAKALDAPQTPEPVETEAPTADIEPVTNQGDELPKVEPDTQDTVTLSKFRWPEEEACPCCMVEKDLADDIVRALGRDAILELESELESFLNATAQRWDGGELSAGDDSRLRELLTPIMEAAYDAGVDIAEAKTGLEGSFTQDDVLAYINERQSLIIEEINQTTEDALRGALARNIEEGGTITEAIEAIKESYPEVTRGRAQTIARTELSNSVQAAEVDQYKRMGIKTVNVINGGRPTPVHVELAKQRQNWPVGEPMVWPGLTISAGGESETFTRSTAHPPFRPNCQCGLVPNQGGDQ